MIKHTLEYSSIKELERDIESKINDMDGYRQQDHVIGLCNDGTIGYFRRSTEELEEHEFEISEAAAAFLLEELGSIKLLFKISLYYQHACPDEFKILAI